MERILKATRASGPADSFSAVVSISAWRRMSLARDERTAR